MPLMAISGHTNCVLKMGANVSRFSYSKIEWAKIRKLFKTVAERPINIVECNFPFVYGDTA